MNVIVNNKTETTETQEKLFGLLARLNLSEKQGIAVAVNNNVVSKTNWNKYELKENDKITIIRATQGG
ncbi:MAG: sulfur carrier protein ThiS [Bacteroidia bacterium]|nr:sulfur carrier protein ThiS [Bacteroidia bacterium]